MTLELADSKQRKILESLIDLNQWEWSNVPVLNSVIGRHVYFCIATELLIYPQHESARSLKRIFNHPEYTDRAIRLKLREMEKAGLIRTFHSEADKRVRFLAPTAEFMQIVAQHTKHLQRLLGKEFMILEK
ncbi:hypothetical protein ACHEXK_07715 [Limnohabitans sp. DCL3]|uniref:hypothetical protein n=1 Tax=Limnohabitans sp. DCL3 TaxID=3374103 RepID=UPI003A8C561B